MAPIANALPWLPLRPPVVRPDLLRERQDDPPDAARLAGVVQHVFPDPPVRLARHANSVGVLVFPAVCVSAWPPEIDLVVPVILAGVDFPTVPGGALVASESPGIHDPLRFALTTPFQVKTFTFHHDSGYFPSRSTCAVKSMLPICMPSWELLRCRRNGLSRVYAHANVRTGHLFAREYMYHGLFG